MRRIAVIDTGSNTIRLVVYDVDVPRKSLNKNRERAKESGGTRKIADIGHLPSGFVYKQIVNMKKTAGLSNYVEPASELGKNKVCTGQSHISNKVCAEQDGSISNKCSDARLVFSNDGVDKASRVLAQLIQCANNLHCDKTYIFATAVLRNVSNSAQAISNIEARIGKKIDLLSGFEEATLGFFGAFAGKQVTEGATLIDLGGGSCEITRCMLDLRLEGEINLFSTLQTTSLKIGCVSAYSQFVGRIFPDREACEKIREATRGELDASGMGCSICSTIENIAYGIGGSIRAIAKIMRELNGANKTPKAIYRSDILNILEQLHADPDSFAHTIVRAVPDRIHSVIPGSLIILEVMERGGIESINICKKGLREGYLLSKVLGT